MTYKLKSYAKMWRNLNKKCQLTFSWYSLDDKAGKVLVVDIKSPAIGLKSAIVDFENFTLSIWRFFQFSALLFSMNSAFAKFLFIIQAEMSKIMESWKIITIPKNPILTKSP